MKTSYIKSSVFRRLLFLALLFFSFTVKAQVGIGNTNPDASSMLDITSTKAGILIPRMSSTERRLIVAPANSLLVFDTTDGAYFYYDTLSTSWIKMNSAGDKRDNYKLVKSVADLAPELSNGGGAKYLLHTNTFYEINGTISLAFPIDLNNAYVSGLDANEDVLSFPGGTVFNGIGGTIKNVTLKGGKAFQITGGGISSNSSLLVLNTIIDGMTTSVGSISGLGLYFGDVIQFIGNANGITYSNIGNLLLSNQAWMSTNGGTFEKFTGSFSLIEKGSGFSTVPASAIGFDVSSNPSVSNGVILGTVFSGLGTFVKGYTIGSYSGYNFTNEWTVDGPGIPREGDAQATGYFYMVDNATLTPTTTANTPVKISGTTTSSNLFRATHPSSNRLDYQGSKIRYFEILCTGTVDNRAGANKRIYTFYLYKNGIKQNAISAERTFSNDDIGNFTLIGSLSLKKDDYIEVYAENTGNAGAILITRLSLVLK